MSVAAYDISGLSGELGAATTDSLGQYKLAKLTPGQALRLLVYDTSHVYATTFAGNADSFETSPSTTFPSGSTTVTVDFQMQLGGSVVGHIHRTDGSPVAGVTVAAYNVGSGTRRDFTATDGSGFYSLVLAPGQYKLAAYNVAGVYPTMFFNNQVDFADATVVSIASLQQSTADMTLDPAAQITGNIIDRANNTRLPSMTVYVYTPAGALVKTATSDAAGAFRISVAAGSYRLLAADTTGLYATSFFGASSFTRSTVLTLASGQTLNETIVMDRGGTVRGRTADAAGNALAGMHVAAYNLDGTLRADTTADATGAYALLLPPDEFMIAAYDVAHSYATQFYRRHIDFATADPILPSSGQITPGIDFQLSPAAHFTGMISNAATGAPLGGISVGAFDATLGLIASTTSNNLGQFSLAVPAGTFRVLAWDDAHVFANAFDGGASTYEATLPRTVASGTNQSVTFSMIVGVKLAGTVMTSTRAGIGGIEVDALTVAGQHVGTATTADDGSFALTLAPSTYKLFVHDPRQVYTSTYYDRAAEIESATAIVLTSGSTPAPVVVVLSTHGVRRRAVGH